MALIKCNECGREVSDKAATCPGCGAPISGSSGVSSGGAAPSQVAEETVVEAHRAIFREMPVLTGLAVILIIGFGAGLIMLLVMWIISRTEGLTITNRRVIYRKGLLSKSTSEVLHNHIRNVQITQTFTDRIFNVGTLAISSAGQADFEINFRGIRDPQKIKETIDSYRF